MKKSPKELSSLKMRIWDLPPSVLCRQHLLAEHRELHALWSILVNGRKGYAHHPETRRWRGRLKALFLRHEELVREMERRGYKHRTPLDPAQASGASLQDEKLESLEQQLVRLKKKNCGCPLRPLPE